MINIAVIGAGQLGSRHLQALASLKHKVAIQVIDSSIDSLKVAEARFKEVSSNFTGTISFHTDITSLEKNIEVAIVATNSKVRKMVVEQLVANSTVKKLILEKFLFVKENDYFTIENLLIKHNIKTWVNCPRRMMTYYQALQKELSGNIHFIVTGNTWGLGSNGIHLLDLFAFLTKSNTIVLSNDLVDKTVIESKRSGYIEFTGTITGHTDQHSFHITSFPNSPAPLHIHINTPTVRYSIEEGATAKVWVSKLENKWSWEEQTFNMPFQSQLTNIAVDELIEKGTCSLTAYKESATLHLLFLNNLISFLQRSNNNNSINECLIT
ncbi:MAG: Gfo/Idh/MocA family oxidoreductase [Bacteroidota bacterium]